MRLDRVITGLVVVTFVVVLVLIVVGLVRGNLDGDVRCATGADEVTVCVEVNG